MRMKRKAVLPCALLAIFLASGAVLVLSPAPTVARSTPVAYTPEAIQIELPNMFCGVLVGPRLKLVGSGINTISCVPKVPKGTCTISPDPLFLEQDRGKR
jgi:hypothetical protein